MKTLKKTFNFGKHNVEGKGAHNLITIEATLKYNKDSKPVFSASGSVYSMRKGDAIISGQCIDSLAEWVGDNPLYVILRGLWERNHLNDMNAGTPEQTKAVEEWKAKGNTYDYSKVCSYLKEIGMYEIELNGEPYKYGHSWLYREITKEDLEQIVNLLS